MGEPGFTFTRLRPIFMAFGQKLPIVWAAETATLMPAYAKNELKIETLPDGTFRLFGYAMGKRIRRWSDNAAHLEQLKAQMENAVRERTVAPSEIRIVRTRLTDAQVREAETALVLLGDRPYTLIECIQAAQTILGDGAPKPIAEARAEWLADMAMNKLAVRTVQDCRTRLDAFIVEIKDRAVTLSEISPGMINSYVFKKELAVYTSVGRARVVRTFLNFCMSKTYLRTSPFQVKMKGLSKKAESESEDTRTLTPEQCERLLNAGIQYENGLLLPYVILSTWCFMRNAEVQETTLEDLHFGDENLVLADKRKLGGGQRQVTIPDNVLPLLRACIERGILRPGEKVPFTQPHYDNLRELAGLIDRAPADRTNKNNPSYRKITGGIWQENILRHTGISYLFKRNGNIADCCRQAGNTPEVAFEHYIKMTRKADADAFYALTGKLIAKPTKSLLICAA
jgi:hypothetical protein